MEISGIDHVVVKVADLDRSIGFYCDVLGCKLEWRRDTLALAHLRAGKSFIDLLAVPNPPSGANQNMDHLCLTVTGFDPVQVRDHLSAQGVEVGPAENRFGASGWGQSLYIVDPDGNRLELRG
jgi:catechol 2,3-dioxygenase-like lactoylglutathione lyase family enzyme